MEVKQKPKGSTLFIIRLATIATMIFLADRVIRGVQTGYLDVPSRNGGVILTGDQAWFGYLFIFANFVVCLAVLYVLSCGARYSKQVGVLSGSLWATSMGLLIFSEHLI